MPGRRGGSGGVTNSPSGGKKQDRRLARRIRRNLVKGNIKNDDQLSNSVSHLIQVMKRTDSHGAFNKKDQRAVGNLVEEIGSRASSIGRDQSGNPDLNKAISKRLERALVRHGNQNGPKPSMDPNSQGGGRNGGRGNGGGGNGNGGRGNNRHGRKGGGGRGIKYDPSVYSETSGLRGRAARIVDSDLHDQLSVLLRGLRGMRRESRHAIGRTQTEGKRTRGDLRTIFGEVADYLGKQNEGIDSAYDRLGARTADAYGDASNRTQGNFEDNLASVQAEQQRLGISGSGLGNLQSDNVNNKGVLAANEQAAQDATAFARTGASAVGSLLSGAVQGERVSSIGQSRNVQNDAVSDIRSNFLENADDIKQQAIDVRQGRGGMIEQLLLQLQDQDYSRWAEQQQNNFLNQMAVSNFNLNRRQFNTEQQWRLAELKRQVAAQRARKRKNTIRSTNQSITNSLNELYGNFF